MTKPERVVASLTGRTPDMVPFIVNTTMKGLQQRLLGREITEPTVDGMNITGWVGRPEDGGETAPLLSTVPEAASLLNLDAIQIQMVPPIYAEKSVENGNVYVLNGLIDGAGALKNVRMPDPDDDKPLLAAEAMISRYKGAFALGARVRLCASPVILSVGLENIAYFYADEDDTLFKTVEMYAEWSRRLNANLSEMDFDFFWAFDDIAYSSGMLVSPAMFKEIFKDGMKRAASAITKPWIFHSDGDYRLILDDILDLGASGIHPIEKASMDTRWLKENYGNKLCLVGNVDIETLTNGTEAETDEEVRRCIDTLGKDGRYILSDSNSVPDGVKPENALAMAGAVEKYRRIY